MKGDSSNETEIIFKDIACGRLTSTYPTTDSKTVRVSKPSLFFFPSSDPVFSLVTQSAIRSVYT